ncbi:hypothetical protein H311_03317, partial [Anncaliia algerae PRA109]
MLLEFFAIFLCLSLCFSLFFIYLHKNTLTIQSEYVFDRNEKINYKSILSLCDKINKLINELTINKREINVKLLVKKIVKRHYFDCLYNESMQLALNGLMNENDTDTLVSIFIRGINEYSKILARMPPELVYCNSIQSSMDIFMENEKINLSKHCLSSLFLIIFLSNTPHVHEIDFEL